MPPIDLGDDLVDQILGHADPSALNLAADDPTRALTYEQLREEVLQAAGGLWQVGVRSQDRVVLLLPNSIDFVVSALAAMSIGATFVPLAPDDPSARIRAIVAETDPTVVVSKRPSGDVGAVDDVLPDRLVRSLAEIQSEMIDVAPRDVDPHRPVYCAYTSGTTGRPKGVVIRHDGLLAATYNSVRYYGLTPGSRTISFFPFHFDASYETIFAMLMAGGCVLIPTPESVRMPRMYIQNVCEEAVTHANISPGFLRLLLASPNLEDLAASELATLSLMGEACWAPDIQRLLNVDPQLRIFNRYGPTEATITVSTYEVDAEELDRELLVPIGRPDPGVVFTLVDESGTVIDAIDEVGELYIGGTQLMSGYWKDAALSAAVLRDDIVSGTQVYRTGDLVVRRDSGDYVYIDRNDNIIKRNGTRISLVEVSRSLSQLGGVTSAVCVASPRRENVVELAAFVVTSTPTTDTELRKALGEQLPASMLPNVIRIVDEFPLTASGKVDLAAMRGLVWPPSLVS